MVIYVCCQDCAAKVKSDPGTYVVKVIADQGAGGTGALAPPAARGPAASEAKTC